MLKSTLLLGQQQKAYALKTKLLPPSSIELEAFQNLQKAMSKLITLIYYKLNKILWINLTTFKEFGFWVIVFYIFPNEELPERKWPFRSFLQPILFLFRLLILAKRNY